MHSVLIRRSNFHEVINMQRAKWWLLCWLLLSLVSPHVTLCSESCQKPVTDGLANARCRMRKVNGILRDERGRNTTNAMRDLEKLLEETKVNETTSMSDERLVVVLHKQNGSFRGLKFSANETEARSGEAVSNHKVSVSLPREMDIGFDNTVVFCQLTWPETNGIIWNSSSPLYASRLVGLSVYGKKISGLQERVNITMHITMGEYETREPSCVFYDFSTEMPEFHEDGCQTEWNRNQSYVTCSCDHLTYFGVLMVSAELNPLDVQIQTYITFIGSSLSLFALVITVLLFITNRKARADVSMKVHISLVIALILLNLHFLLSAAVAAQASEQLCFYMAVALHYFLLASFSWMALEGFHLYLLLVKVFNIYVRRYLLKLSVVGWGIPAVIVSLVLIINRHTYGPVALNSKSNSTDMCYIGDDTVKMVTTVGVFSLVFVLNMIMLGVTVRRLMSLRQCKKFGERDCSRAKRDICTLLGISTLLGITWGLIFFSTGEITTAVLYLFCILSSLQGFFIFLWFVMSLRKTDVSVAKTSSETRSTNIQT